MTLPLVYLCRHGQTAWNAEARLQGQRDIELNALGRSQARRNGERLREVEGIADFRFLASPLARCRETMRILRQALGLPPDEYETDARLVEIHYGDWEGFTLDELEAREAGSIARRAKDKWRFLPPGALAESYEALTSRIAPVFEALDRPSVVVAHGGVARAFLTIYGGASVEDAVHATIPQDRILRAEAGRMDWV